MSFPDLRHFAESEFDHADEMDEGFLRTLDAIRHVSEVPIRITSDFRTPEENEEIGGFHDSPHMRGRAVDLVPIPDTSLNRFKVIKAMLNLTMTRLGLGVYDRHLHFDLDRKLSRPHLWNGISK